jgi:hypothetical protein
MVHSAFAAPLVARIDFDAARSVLRELSWDTEGGSRATTNLLRKGKTVSTAGPLEVSADHGTIVMKVGAANVDMNELVIPFDPLVCATTVMPAQWDDDGRFHLPAIISAPDFGQMRLSEANGVNLMGRLVGSRSDHAVDVVIELPPQAIELKFEPVILPTPKNIDEKTWRMARRGWWNAIEPSAKWGDQSRKFSAPAGVLANNVVSDPVSCLMHVWADQILLTPAFDKDIHLADLVRRTIDWWIDHRTKDNGEVYAYWDHADMLDANCSPLIASWDYIETSGDRAWLERRIEKLEFLANYLLKRDLDGDGLIESTHSGNSGTLIEPMRAGSAYDTINAGYKDAYSNILAYRAFRCMADLEKQLNRPEQSATYSRQADKLKAAFEPLFFNPQTGWLAWWKSEDGKMHDLSAPMITSLAICYGLVPPEKGREMLNKLWAKIESVGFKRFDLGVPFTLVPVPRGDYLIGLEGAGVPKKEDGSDTFGQYLNGGCLVNDAIHFITALYICGENAKADRILNAMLERQDKGVFPNGGGFQNGVVNEWPKGAEFYEWDGKTSGYEGHLTYSFTFLQAIFLRDPAYRAKLFRPLQ